MHLDKISIRNFRLLRRGCIALAESRPATVLVGSNNSGKTSVIEAMRLFFGSGSEGKRRPPCLFDLSIARHKDFDRIEKRLTGVEKEERRIEINRRFAPRIRLELVFSYDEETPDLVVANELLMNLDPSQNQVALRAEYSIDSAKDLLVDFAARRKKEQTLSEFLIDSLDNYYKVHLYKISVDRKEAVQLDGNGILKRLLQLDVITAQRYLDDDETNRAAKLSKLIHLHYDQYYKTEEVAGYDEIEDAIRTSAADLTVKYGGAFSRLTSRLKNFGYPQGHTCPDLKIRAEMNAETIYRDNTRVYYTGEHTKLGGAQETFELPERYNGLGYKNLIFMVLQLESFRAALEARVDDRPRVHIIAIEEPEAHLHPQIQCIFIKEISKALEATDESVAQVIISTHSSHIVANSGFEPIRYFRRSRNEVTIRDLSALPVEDEETLKFLRRYVKLTHCDLFFADKAIFVEGQVERLLLPDMLAKCGDTSSGKTLVRQYVSISEVGGAHVHKFEPLLDFIGIPTLVIADIDTVDDARKKCPVDEGVGTSNAALRNWIPGKKNKDELLAATESEKTRRNIRVTYQNTEGGKCGRSFEEAFIYANIDWLALNFDKLEASKGVFKGLTKETLVDMAYKRSA